jgi:hypothetical protein
MRWLFADPTNADEAAHVRETIEKIDQWWQSFQAKQSNIEGVLSGKTRWKLPQFMEENLQSIDPRLMWEFGPAVRQSGHRLVITPETARWLRPMLRTLLERAPKIDGWEFYGYRQPETPEQAMAAVKARIGLNIKRAVLEASVAAGRKIDVRFGFPGQKFDEDAAREAAFVATETLMGEQVLDTWIGDIGLLEADELEESRSLPLDRGQATVAALIRGLIDQLPAARACDISARQNWATVQLDPPEPADDYPDRSDLMVASTGDVELIQATHSGQPFSSACHSKIGEKFCYLKIDGVDVDQAQIVAFRSAFEDALNPLLLEASAGCCIGGGSGVRYAYIDLALSDLKRAVPIIRQTLAEQDAPVRSWLLFHDDDLAAEWIGIHPQTPPPPSATENEGE